MTRRDAIGTTVVVVVVLVVIIIGASCRPRHDHLQPGGIYESHYTLDYRKYSTSSTTSASGSQPSVLWTKSMNFASGITIYSQDDNGIIPVAISQDDCEVIGTGQAIGNGGVSTTRVPAFGITPSTSSSPQSRLG